MKILNFGSLNLDFTYQVERFVRPGETIASAALKTNLGGKGLNQSVALAHAGAEIYHAGKIGEDGEVLRDFLKNNGVDVRFIRHCEGRTGHAVIQVDESGQNSIILFGGANQTVTEEFISEVISYFELGDVLLLQNEINALPQIMSAAYKKGLHIALNPSPCNAIINDLPLEYVKWFFINETEGNALTGKHEPEEIVTELLTRYPNSAVILTLGEKGVLYGNGDTRISRAVYNVMPVDTTGAGDTFTGYFLAGVTRGQDVREALKYATAASALAISSSGAAEAIPRFEAVRAFLRERGEE